MPTAGDKCRAGEDERGKMSILYRITLKGKTHVHADRNHILFSLASVQLHTSISHHRSDTDHILLSHDADSDDRAERYLCLFHTFQMK